MLRTGWHQSEAISWRGILRITIQQDDNAFDLPKGDYYFFELFCDECDCRRVFLQIFLNQKKVATIAYGWEKLSFYRKEFKGFDEEEIKELKGPALDTFQYQSVIADKKRFMIPLADLKVIDKKSDNYLFLYDYSVWFVNY